MEWNGDIAYLDDVIVLNGMEWNGDTAYLDDVNVMLVLLMTICAI